MKLCRLLGPHEADLHEVERADEVFGQAEATGPLSSRPSPICSPPAHSVTLPPLPASAHAGGGIPTRTGRSYFLQDDFSQANDLAETQPEKLEELKALFWTVLVVRPRMR